MSTKTQDLNLTLHMVNLRRQLANWTNCDARLARPLCDIGVIQIISDFWEKLTDVKRRSRRGPQQDLLTKKEKFSFPFS